jgi:hypothetical protein
MVIKVGSGEIDDLSTLNILDEENLLRELRARYKKGIIYVSLQSIIITFTFNSIHRHTSEIFYLQSIHLNN